MVVSPTRCCNAVGAADEAAVAEILATVDAVLDTGATVVWYTPAAPAVANFWNFSRIAVERPAVHTLVAEPPDAVVDEVRRVAAQRTEAAAGELDTPVTRVLVIGDSTSLNFAWALQDGGDGRVDVLWAGANGCPLAPVVAAHGRSDGVWTDRNCTPWDQKVLPLLESFRPDVLLVMTGPTELQEHILVGATTGAVATDPVFAIGREVAVRSAAGRCRARAPGARRRPASDR